MLIKLLSNKKITLLILLSTVALTGCSSDGEERPVYAQATTVKSLEVPPRLTIPDTRGALRLPKPSKEVMPTKEGVVESPVIAPLYKGLDLKNQSRLYWLEINKPVDAVWASLPGFFAAEGIKLDRAEKLLGFVDTQWMDEIKKTYDGESSGWFSGFSVDFKDRFRIRLEAQKDEQGNKTRMYVSHRGLQPGDESGWVQRESEPLLEREILYRYVLYIGISENGAKELLEAYSSYLPRVDVPEGSSNKFNVKGEENLVWLRLQMAMDRLGVDVLKSDKASSSITVDVAEFNVEKIQHENDSEAHTDAMPKGVRKILQIKQTAGELSSVISIVNENGSVISAAPAMSFRDALVKQLK